MQAIESDAADPRAGIGVLDSGLGGLSVLRALVARLPQEDFLYCADSAHAPWGDKSHAYIIERCRAITAFLMAHRIKALVLACNTATAVAADVLRAELSIPVIGIEPAVKPAAARSQAARIGVLATTRTIESARYRSLVERFAQGAQVVSVQAPGLMECVERGQCDSADTRRLLEKYLAPFQRAGIDKLVLGCTHYPFLSKQIASMMGPSVELIEPGQAVAAVTALRLEQHHSQRTGWGKGSVRFWISGCARHRTVLERLWPAPEAFTPEELEV